MTGILYILIVIKVASICNMLQKGWTARDMAVNRKMHVISRTLREAEERQSHIRQLYRSADHYGTVLMQLLTVLIVGPPGVGKSSLSHSILGKPLPIRRHSSQGATFSPQLTVSSNTFKWTQLTFSGVVDEIADVIAPIVHDQASNTATMKRQRFARIKHYVKRYTTSPHHSTSPSSKRHKPLISQRSDSLDDAVISRVVSNESHTDKGSKSFVTIIDSGGQKAFLNLYPIFIRNPSLVMVVFKMTDEVDCIWKPLPLEEYHCPEGVFTNPHQTSQSVADLIKHTMANISTYTSAENGSKATRVLCVGTHKDMVSPASITAIDQQLNDLVCESGYTSIVAPKGGNTKVLFPVNNLVAGHLDLEDEVIQQIRRVPLNLADCKDDDRPVYEVRIRWIKLEVWIREQCNLNDVKFMAYKEALDTAINSYHFSDEDEFLAMLEYFHSLSLLLYYHNIPYLTDIIIVDNNFILTKASKLVELSFIGAGLTPVEFNNFKYCGIFSKELLNHPNLDDDINPQGLLQLLMSLNIVSPLSDDHYFMPCVLPSIEDYTKSCEDFLSANYGAKQYEAIDIQFSTGSFPRGVFCSLVVCLMNSEHTAKRWSLCRSTEKHKEVFCNFATFTLPTGHRVSIHDKLTHCRVQIHHKNPFTTTTVHCEVQKVIVNFLKEVCTTMSLSADFCIGFQCSGQECHHSNNCFVMSEVSLPLHDSDVHSICKLTSKPSRLREQHIVWFKSANNGPAMDVPRRGTVTTSDIISTDHSSHTPVDISELLVYSQDWTTEWWSIGVKLGLPVQRLEEIRIDHRRVQDCCHQMLLLWSRADPTSCYCKLVTALDQLNMKEAAMRLAKEL
ncbi:uncharacterized protein [Dysidea avara]|uniref:uncharacterized protein n=1 Tax=Dysidea avara TaxID=196820 RepID=UPI0033186CAB